jgi:ABC-2 type transport system permease protein
MNEEMELREQNPPVPFLMGPFHFLSTIFTERYLVRNLVHKELRAKYKRAVLGYGWTFLEPFLLSGLYYALFTLLAGKSEPLYPLWVLIGVIVWGHFSRTLTATVSCLNRNGILIKQIFVPREILAVIPGLTQLCVATLSLSALVPAMWYLGVTPSVALWMLPIGFALTTMTAIGLGLMFAPLNAISEDVSHLFRFITRAGFFLSPVMWTLDMVHQRDPTGKWADLVMLNPMVLPITMVRHAVDGIPLEVAQQHWFYCIAWAVGSLLVGTAVFKRWEAKAVKYL